MNDKESQRFGKIIIFPQPDTAGSTGNAEIGSDVGADNIQTSPRKRQISGGRVYKRSEENPEPGRKRVENNPSRQPAGVERTRRRENIDPPIPPENGIELPPFGEDPIDWYFSQVEKAKADRKNLEVQQNKILQLIQSTNDDSLKNQYNILHKGSGTEEGAKKLTDLMFLNDLESASNTLRVYGNQFSGTNRTKADYVWQIIAPIVEYQEIYQENFESNRKEFEKKGKDIKWIREADDLFKNLVVSQKGPSQYKPDDLVVAKRLNGDTLAVKETNLPNTDAVSFLNNFQDTSVSSRQKINQLYNWYQNEFKLSEQIKVQYRVDLDVSQEYVIRYKLDQSVDHYFHNAMDFFERSHRTFNDTEREEYEQFLKNLREGLDAKFRARRWFQLHYLDYQSLRGGGLSKMAETQHTSGIPETIKAIVGEVPESNVIPALMTGIVKSTPGFQQVYNLYDQQAKIRWLEHEQRGLRIALGEIDDYSGKEETKVVRLRGKSKQQAEIRLDEITSDIDSRKSEVDGMIGKAENALFDDGVTFDDVKKFSEVYSGVEGLETEYTDPKFVQTTNAFRLVKRFREVTGQDAQLRKFAEVPWERKDEKVGYNFVKIFDLEGWIIKENIPESQRAIHKGLLKIPIANFWEERQGPLVLSSAFDRTFEGEKRAQRRRLKRDKKTGECIVTPADFGLPEKFTIKNDAGVDVEILTFPTDIEGKDDLTEVEKDAAIEKRIGQLATAFRNRKLGDKKYGISIDTAYINWAKIDLSKMSDEDSYEGYWVDVGKADKLRKSIHSFLLEGQFVVSGQESPIDQIKEHARDFNEIWGPGYAREWVELTTSPMMSQIRQIRNQKRTEAGSQLPIGIPLEELAYREIMGLTQRGSAKQAGIFEYEHYQTYLSCLKNPDGTDKYSTLFDFYTNYPTIKDGAILVANLLGGGAYQVKTNEYGVPSIDDSFDKDGKIIREYIVGDLENGGRELIETFLNVKDDGSEIFEEDDDYVTYEEFLSYAGLKYDIDPDYSGPQHPRVRFANKEELHIDPKNPKINRTTLIEGKDGKLFPLSENKVEIIKNALREKLRGGDDELYGLIYGWPQIQGKIIDRAAKLYTGSDHVYEKELEETFLLKEQIAKNLVPQLRQPVNLEKNDKPTRQYELDKPLSNPDVDPMLVSCLGNWLTWSEDVKKDPNVPLSLPLRLYYDKTTAIKEMYLYLSAPLADKRGETNPWKSQPTPADWHEGLMDLEGERGGAQYLTQEERIKLETELNCNTENVVWQNIQRAVNNIPDARGEIAKDKAFDTPRKLMLNILPPPLRIIGSFVVPKLVPPGWETVSQFGLGAVGATIGTVTSGPMGGVLGFSVGYMAGNDWDHRSNWIPAGWGRFLLTRKWARSNTIPGTGIKIGAHDWPFPGTELAKIIRHKLNVYSIRE